MLKNIFLNRKVWIGFAVVALLVILFFVFRKKAKPQLGLVDPNLMDNKPDSWLGLRQSLGEWNERQEGEDDKMWTAAGQVFLSHLEAKERAKQIEPYWRAMYAWFKGQNIRPNGWQVIINKPLQDAVKSYVNANPGISQSTVAVGQNIDS